MDRGLADSPPASPEGSSFELERFTWVAPHLLEVAGTFSALGPRALAEPFLLVHGPQRSHRLPVLPDSLQDDPQDGRPWGATFAWQEPPVPFDAAELRVGPDVIVELPEPGASGAGDGRPRLPVHPLAADAVAGFAGAGSVAAEDDDVRDGAPDGEDGADAGGPDPETEPAGADELSAAVGQDDGGDGVADSPDPDRTLTAIIAPDAAGGAAAVDGPPGPRSAFDAFGLHADLLAAQEEVRELRAAVQRADEDLARSRQDLEAERHRHDGEVGRFKEGLATVRTMAADALAAEQAAAEQAGAELRDAQNALRGRDEELGQVQQALRDRDGALEEAHAALQDAQGALQDAQDALQARDAALLDGQEALRVREEALQGAQAALDDARAAVRGRDDALHEAQAALEARDHALREAYAERDAARAAVEAAGADREAAAEAHEQRQAQLVQQITALRDHGADLEAARDAMERRVAGLEASHRRAAEARGELQLARDAADEARVRLERALDALPVADGAG